MVNKIYKSLIQWQLRLLHVLTKSNVFGINYYKKFRFDIIVVCIRLIIKAEAELMRASVDASRSGKALEDQLDQFERKKISLLKVLFIIVIRFH